jgi:hypothetical protein
MKTLLAHVHVTGCRKFPSYAHPTTGKISSSVKIKIYRII